MGSHGQIAKLRLSLNRALFGEVFPQLRAALVRADAQSWEIRFYVDGEISDDHRDSLTSAGAEVMADMEPDMKYSEEIIRLDAPARILHDHGWFAAFARKE
jgi:hypothetical protein